MLELCCLVRGTAGLQVVHQLTCEEQDELSLPDLPVDLVPIPYTVPGTPYRRVRVPRYNCVWEASYLHYFQIRECLMNVFVPVDRRNTDGTSSATRDSSFGLGSTILVSVTTERQNIPRLMPFGDRSWSCPLGQSSIGSGCRYHLIIA